MQIIALRRYDAILTSPSPSNLPPSPSVFESSSFESSSPLLTFKSSLPPFESSHFYPTFVSLFKCRVVKELREYQIPHVGLKPGMHHYNFEIGEDFFSHFEGSQVHEARIFADLALDKKERLFVLNFDISGTIRTDCDRCGQPFDLPLHGNYTMYVKVGDDREEDADSEEVIWISEGESILDVSGMLYEFIHLSIPIQRVHPDKPDGTLGCDPEILKLLGTQDNENKEHDPRWDILDQLNQN